MRSTHHGGESVVSTETAGATGMGAAGNVVRHSAQHFIRSVLTTALGGGTETVHTAQMRKPRHGGRTVLPMVPELADSPLNSRPRGL